MRGNKTCYRDAQVRLAFQDAMQSTAGMGETVYVPPAGKGLSRFQAGVARSEYLSMSPSPSCSFAVRFRHPDGREIDEKRGNRAGKARS